MYFWTFTIDILPNSENMENIQNKMKIGLKDYLKIDLYVLVN